MSTNKTEHLQLHRWESTDEFRREEFNENFTKVDGAIEALSAERIAVGSYVGNGANSRTIQLPFEPKFVIVFGQINSDTSVGIFTPEDVRYVAGSGCGGSSNYNLKLQGDQLIVRNASWNNASGKTVSYIAIR